MGPPPQQERGRRAGAKGAPIRDTARGGDGPAGGDAPWCTSSARRPDRQRRQERGSHCKQQHGDPRVAQGARHPQPTA
eukprot:3752008-Alexandrium_andersonii.AAC.1